MEYTYMKEWRNVTESEYKKYEVSNDGKVRNSETGHILKPGLNPNGYPIVVLSHNGITKTRTVHRLIANAFYGDHEGFVVDHIDGDKTNNKLENLEFCTSGENNRRAYEKGLKMPIHTYAQPNNKKVKVIETGEVYSSINECARAIGANRRHIQDCLRGELKSHRGYHYEEVI